ncbi:MAG: 50S ribosomal protein L15 [Nanoarchaeota archaeon]|nr:50S ribosomal protein L15 [Nanoarchaeota archaeon]MCG2718480.1 50S ribosomal protein L15 [Nanoarchaeota archaeon]
MSVNRRKKNVRQRANNSHGWGARKKHRGAGSRGGRGMAGSGKRADQKKPSILKEYGNSYFGRSGFVKHNKRIVKSVNISYLEEQIPNLLSKKLINEKDKSYVIDLKTLGYNKLIGSGNVTKKFVITVEAASHKAVEKVAKAGGKVILPAEPTKE